MPYPITPTKISVFSDLQKFPKRWKFARSVELPKAIESFQLQELHLLTPLPGLCPWTSLRAPLQTF